MPATLFETADKIRHGKQTPLEVLEGCLAQIDRYEKRVRAWVLIDRERARAEAAGATTELERGQWRGPLHGIPLGIKDIIDVFDWPTAAGSRLWAQSIARRDATIVERLRQAGAVLLGKTVTTQFASFDPPPTRNPWDTRRTPGGSSSGSAAALACGMCLGTLGSQTGGSITRPAAYCGVASCKPTFGRASTDGIVALAPSMDHPGPLARCVRDLAILLRTIAGPDHRDSTCANQAVPNYVEAVAQQRSAPRLGQLRGLFEERAEPVMTRLVDTAASQFTQQDANVSEVALPASFAPVLANHRVVMAVEAAAYHRTRLARHPDDYGTEIRKLLDEGLACPATEYARCKDHQQQLQRDILSCFQNVDALLTPATTCPAPPADTTGDPAFNSPWSYAGLPTVSLPAGWTPDGLPVSIQLIGPPWREAELLAVAAWCEQTLNFETRTPAD
jgi:Asp-tRNA(Asn)/Glu-tRNA(Gln) amidotransferase A subunit family amidase